MRALLLGRFWVGALSGFGTLSSTLFAIVAKTLRYVHPVDQVALVRALGWIVDEKAGRLWMLFPTYLKGVPDGG